MATQAGSADQRGAAKSQPGGWLNAKQRGQPETNKPANTPVDE
jgi:hypothetical protein